MSGFGSHSKSLAHTTTRGHARLHRALHALAVLSVVASAAPACAQTFAQPVTGMFDGEICPPPSPPMDSLPQVKREAARQDIGRRSRNDWGGLCRYRAANASETTPVRAVFIGDSITEFWGPAAPELFADGVVNRGIGAQTSPQMLLRFYQDVVSLRPRVVHIMAGTNDIAGNSGPNRPEDFKNNIRAMVELAKANDIAIILGAIPPSATFYWRPELRPAPRISELNAWLHFYARTEGLQFIDYAAAMAGPGGELPAELSKDGVHPDARGYAIMTPLARRALADALETPGATP